jgi:subtilisin family serine protease
VVVAASGNESKSTVDSPGCDTGVIAVGASSYNDGMPNGSGFTGASTEYVGSYSNDGSVNVLRSATSWGIVAPGGDPTSSDNDNLHWIENIWTSTPFDSTFAGACNIDAFSETNDCRVLIAGTSMATPHVAGAAALILSVNATYQSATAMKQLLCQSADNIGDTRQGCGRVNVYRAMAIATGDPNLP